MFLPMRILLTCAVWGSRLISSRSGLAAIAGKFLGGMLAARARRMPKRQSTAIGLLMNTRGLTEIVILHVGVQLGTGVRAADGWAACWASYQAPGCHRCAHGVVDISVAPIWAGALRWMKFS